MTVHTPQTQRHRDYQNLGMEPYANGNYHSQRNSVDLNRLERK